MKTRLILLGITLAVVGCRYGGGRSGGGPVRTPTMLGKAAPPANAPRSQLAITGPAPIRKQDPVPPGPPDELALVPPRPPGEPVIEARAASPNAIQPAGGVLPDAPIAPAAYPDGELSVDRPRLRREPRPGDLPSPLAGNPAPAVPSSPQPAQADPRAENLAQLKRLLQVASERWQSIDTYEAHMTRRETIGKQQSPEEEILFQFRKEPFSVYMRFTGKVGTGRELVYVLGAYNDKMQIRTGPGDGFAGIRRSYSPEDPEVKSRSRHSIREAGFGNAIARVAAAVQDLEAGKLKPDALRFVATARRADYPNTPLQLVTRVIRPGEDPALPTGGVRQWYFDARPGSPSYAFPVLVTLHDGANRELEYYRYSQVKAPAGLTDADFSPNRLGKKR